MDKKSFLQKFFFKRNKQDGFTVVELILVVGIMSLVVLSAGSLGTNFLVRNATQNTINELASSLRVARLNTMSSKNDSDWGVSVSSNAITLFSGNTFASRDPVYDESFDIPSSMSVSPLVEVVFLRPSGDTVGATFTVSNNIGETTVISINEVGVVDAN